MSSGRPHDRYFVLSEPEQRQVQAILAKGAKAGRAPDHAAIEAAIEMVLARRALLLHRDDPSHRRSGRGGAGR